MKEFNRRTGRSTALAFDYLAQAYRNPGERIPVLDHLGTRESSRYLWEEMQKMCSRLGFILAFSRDARSNYYVAFNGMPDTILCHNCHSACHPKFTRDFNARINSTPTTYQRVKICLHCFEGEKP